MTLETHIGAGTTQLCTVRIMAIAAGHAFRKHLALLEGGVVVSLFVVTHLAVGGKGRAIKQRDFVCVGKPLTRDPVFGKFTASCVAEAAGFDLLAGMPVLAF
jgi:hypothetical protein